MVTVFFWSSVWLLWSLFDCNSLCTQYTHFVLSYLNVFGTHCVEVVDHPDFGVVCWYCTKLPSTLMSTSSVSLPFSKANVYVFCINDSQFSHKYYISLPITTSSSAIAERPSCRWVSYGQKWKTGTGRQYLRTLQVYIQPMTNKAIEFGENAK